MFDGILDSIPLVGHVKGAVHYFSGDRIAARRSMYEATRSFAVIAGGVAGAVGGPAGVAAGAAAGGAAADAVTSLYVQNPQGIVAGIADIAGDISHGENPLGSIAKTTLIVATDIVGGAAGPTIGNCVTKAVTESTGKKLVIDITTSGIKQVAATRLAHGATRGVIASTEPPVGMRVEKSRSNSSRSTSQQSSQKSSKTKQQTKQNTNTDKSSDKKSTSSKTNQQTNQNTNTDKSSDKKSTSSKTDQQTNQNTNTGKSNDKKSTSSNDSGQQQGKNNNPDDDKNNKKKDCKNAPPPKPESHWKKFLKIFGVESLDEIIIKGVKIFKDINSWQKKELKDFIIDVNNKYERLELSTIIKMTEALISELDSNQVTAHNFVNLAKFALAYLCQELTDEMELFCKSAKDFTTDRDTVAEKISQADDNATKVVDVFRALMNEIGSLSSMLNPNFVNSIAAVYHYFKHKFIKAKNRLFAPAEYVNLAREGLDRLKSLPQFEILQSEGKTRIVYEKYYADVGRRLVIVIKKQNGCWNVSSVYFEDVSQDGDKDGDEWINGKKVPRKEGDALE